MNILLSYLIIINNRYPNEIATFNNYCTLGLEHVKQYLYFIKEYFYTDDFYSKTVTLTNKQQNEFNTLTNGLDLRGITINSLNKIFIEKPDKLLKEIKKRQHKYDQTLIKIINQCINFF